MKVQMGSCRLDGQTLAPTITKPLAVISEGLLVQSSRGYLNTLGWTNSESATIPVDVERKSDVIAAKVAGVVAAGHRTDTIATMLGVSARVVQEARTGRKRVRGPQRKSLRGDSAQTPRTTFRDLVEPLKRLFAATPGMSISEAARQLGCSTNSARRAYDAAFPEIIEEARATGTPPQRSSRSRLSKAEIERVKELLRQGVKSCEIESEIGCSSTTVARIRSQL